MVEALTVNGAMPLEGVTASIAVGAGAAVPDTV